MSTVIFILVYGISYGLILCLVSIGLVITMGLMRVINIAHGAFAAVGGYFCVSLGARFGLPFPVAVAVAVLLVVGLSLVLERLFFVQLYGSVELDQVLQTIGLTYGAIGVFALTFGPNVFPVKLPPYMLGSFPLGQVDIETYRLVVAAVSLLVVAALWIVFDRTNFGARLRAAVDNPSMAEATGINVRHLFSITFALGAALAALGGAIGASMFPLEPYYPFRYIVLMMMVVVLSGRGNIKAATVVSIVIGISETGVRLLLPEIGSFLIYLVLIVMVVWRPEGLYARNDAT
jgi:branched-chain amino acid transport system permease protein